jgi:hypothetical protein
MATGAAVAALVALNWWILSGSMTRPGAVVSSPKAAVAADFKFDPATCKQNTGSFYVALGRYVFATAGTAMANVVIDPIPESRLLKVPDPKDPKGCFGNPLQSNSHAMFYPMAFGSDIPGQSKLLVPDLLTLANLKRGAGGGEEKDVDWPAEALELEIAENACKAATLREELKSGLLACRIKPVDPPNARKEDWAASYIAKQEIYTTPLGKLFVIDCGPNLLSAPISHCYVAYAINPGIGLTYRFQPYRANNPIPIDLAITYDKSLRAFIERALVKDYPWPD